MIGDVSPRLARIIPGFMAQGGDITHGNGRGEDKTAEIRSGWEGDMGDMGIWYGDAMALHSDVSIYPFLVFEEYLVCGKCIFIVILTAT